MEWTPETLGPWLRAMRQKAGLSLDLLGERVGRTRQQLIDYEKGRRDPGGVILMKIITELGATIDAPEAAPAVTSVTTELLGLAETVDRLRAAVEEQGIATAAATRATELIRRQRAGEPVESGHLLRVADALAAAMKGYEELEADLREAAQGSMPA